MTDQPQEEVKPANAEEEKPTHAAEKKPALTVVIQSWWTPALAVLALVVGLLIGYFGRPLVNQSADTTGNVAAVTSPDSSSITDQPTLPTPTVDPTELAKSQQELMDYLVSNTTHFKGDPNAMVTIIEFSDYQWPYCGRFAADAGRQIEKNYVDTGKVRFGYFNFAFLGDESQWAAEAAECAGDQDAYWEYHDYLFSHQNGENQGAFSKDNLKSFAADLKLDTQAFNACLDSGKYTEAVTNQTNLARGLGVQSTPTFAVNGLAVVGAQTYDTFKQKIDSLLAP
jgi:protein-disulfide isomerase